ANRDFSRGHPIQQAIEGAQNALRNLNAPGGNTQDNIRAYQDAIQRLRDEYNRVRRDLNNAGRTDDANAVDILSPAQGNRPVSTVRSALDELTRLGGQFSSTLTEIGKKQ